MFGDDHVWQRRSPYSNRIAVGTSVVTHAVLAAFAIWLSTLPRSFASAESAPIARKVFGLDDEAVKAALTDLAAPHLGQPPAVGQRFTARAPNISQDNEQTGRAHPRP